jgi:uncharacterized protein YndB with AHSA1/START domain
MSPTTALEIETPPDLPVINWRRFVAAPPELVWDVFTRCEHLANWWGPAYLKLVVCEIDLRPGGAYRHVVRAPDGTEHSFHGEYRVVERPHRLVNTFVYDGAPEHVAVDSLDIEAVDGGTMLIGHSELPSMEAREQHVTSGMEAGMRESYDRLTTLVAALQQEA